MSKGIPWFMVDLDNFTILTSLTIPGDISDTKKIVMGESAVPGLGYEPLTPGGMGNRKVAFEIPIIKRNFPLGNTLILKGFEQLRNQVQGFLSFGGGEQFSKGPKVLYYWGTNSIPLEYYVTKCDFVHKEGYVNEFGFTQFTAVSIELVLDEESLLYLGEQLFRQVSAIAGTVLNVIEVTQSIVEGTRCY